MAFITGQKVVCVTNHVNLSNAENRLWVRWLKAVPEIGKVYTIREIPEASGSGKGIFAIRLVEIVNPPLNWVWQGESGWAEPAFRQEWFRPLAEKKTDISVFQKMLIPKPQVVKV